MDRKALTITLKKDILRQVDSIIDGAQLRNRSHAIEYILGEHFNPKLRKAVILAGGQGVKMRPLTLEVPKTMIPVKGRPILEYLIEWLHSAGIRELGIVVGGLGSKIRDYFGDGTRYDVKITYFDEGTPRGTGGALNLTKDYVGRDTSLVVFGDELVSLDVKDFLNFHEESGGVITSALTSIDDPSGYGSVRLHGANVVEFTEKPKSHYSTSRLVSAGIHLIQPEIFETFPLKRTFSLEKDVFPKLARAGKMRGYVFSGPWFDVGTPEQYERALKEWPSNKSSN